MDDPIPRGINLKDQTKILCLKISTYVHIILQDQKGKESRKMEVFFHSLVKETGLVFRTRRDEVYKKKDHQILSAMYHI